MGNINNYFAFTVICVVVEVYAFFFVGKVHTLQCFEGKKTRLEGAGPTNSSCPALPSQKRSANNRVDRKN